MNRAKWIVLLLIVLLSLIVGGFIGWKIHPNVKVITKTEYVKGDPIKGHVNVYNPTIKNSIIYKEIPIDTVSLLTQIINAGLYEELLGSHLRLDTVYMTSRDSSRIVDDWRMVREYTQTLFDNDTIGNMNITSTVQFNRLRTLDYTFTPAYKTVTKIIEPNRVIPYIGIGGTSMPSIDFEVGLFMKNKYGIAFDYQYDFDRRVHIYGGKIIRRF